MLHRASLRRMYYPAMRDMRVVSAIALLIVAGASGDRSRHISAAARHRCAPLCGPADAADERIERDSGRGHRHASRRDSRDPGGLSRSGVDDGGRQGDDGDQRHLRRARRADRASRQPAASADTCRRDRGSGCRLRHSLSRHAGERPASPQQHPRRSHRLQRELVQPRAPVAADDRSSRRQSHRRVDRHDQVRLPGRLQRHHRRTA